MNVKDNLECFPSIESQNWIICQASLKYITDQILGVISVPV